MAVTSQMSEAVSSSRAAMMRAAILIEPGRFEIQEVPVPQPGPGEVLIRLQGCGVCASNIPPFEGREWFNYPMEPGALGHEGWGIVEAIGGSQADPEISGSKSEIAVGDRAAFLSNHAYADYDTAPIEAVVKLPDSLSGKPFPGEPLGCGINIFKRSGVKAGDTVAIIGIGFLGALLTHLCTRAGARVIAVARKQYALDLAKGMGAAELVPMHDHNTIIEQVKELTGGTFCDVVIECVGKQWPLDLAAELTKERGRLIIAGFHQDGPRQINMFLWNWRGLDVINAHEREQQVYIDGIREAMRAVENGDLDPKPLFTHRFSLDQIGEALNMTKERPDGFMKALIVMER